MTFPFSLFVVCLFTFAMDRSRAFDALTFSVAEALPVLNYEKLLTLRSTPEIYFLIVSAIDVDG